MNGTQSYPLKLKTYIIQVLAGLLIVLSLVSCSKRPDYPKPPVKGPEVVFDINTLKPDVPQFFTYNFKNKNLRFFVIKSGDKVLSFFDGCATCYKANLGYRFENGHFICKKCNMKYSIPEMEKGFGGCFPVRVTGHIEGTKYIIPISLIEKASGLF